MDIFFENFLHFLSLCVFENFFIQIFSLFPQNLTMHTKVLMFFGELFGLFCLFFIGFLFSIFCKKLNILQKEVNYKALKFPMFALFSPIFLVSMPTAIFAFFIGYKKHMFDFKKTIILIILIRFFCNIFGLYF